LYATRGGEGRPGSYSRRPVAPNVVVSLPCVHRTNPLQKRARQSPSDE
jgi:hypothetical protein